MGCCPWGREESDTTDVALAAAVVAAVSTQEFHLVATRMNYSSLKGQVRVISSICGLPDFQISQKFYLFLMATYMELLRFSIFC